jgi:ABC-type multidrug transport system fused ATPase/permease subunit
MTRLRDQWRFVKSALKGRRAAAAALFLILLSMALAESVGLSLIFPIIRTMTGEELPGFMKPFFPSTARGGLPVLLAIFLAILSIKFLLTLIKVYYSKKFVWGLRLSLMQRLFQKHLHADYAFLADRKQGEMMNNLLNETHRGALCLSQTIEFLSKSLLAAALYITLLCFHWQTTLFMTGAVGILLALTHKISKRYSRDFGAKKIKSYQEMHHLSAEAFASIKEIKSYSLENRFHSEFDSQSRRLMRLEIMFDFFRTLPAPIGEITIAFLVVFGLGVLHGLNPGLSTESLLPALAVFVAVGQRMISAVSQLASLRLQIHSLVPSLRLSHSLTSEAIPQESLARGNVLAALSSDIRIENLTFRYRPDARPVLENFTMTLARNRMTALVGASGSGKSTLADLLMGLYRPESGSILVNGKPLDSWSLESWRRIVGYVAQDPVLFNTTVRENILLGNPRASEDKITRAAENAFAHDFILRFPEGYDTLVGDRGVKLSGGQKQRIAIARALVRNPEFLIFDEATSALDDESESMIQRAIENLAGLKTLLVIAHRTTTIRRADRVYDLNELAARPFNSKNAK